MDTGNTTARQVPVLVGLAALAASALGGCATTSSDGSEPKARMEMKPSAQALVGMIQRPIPPMDVSPPAHVEVATFGLG